MTDKLPKVLTPEEQQDLLDQFNPRYWSPHRNRTLIAFALATGLRAGELVAVRDEHLDLDAAGGQVTVREGKGAKDRVVHFSPHVRDELREWMERRDEEAPDTTVLFPTRNGDPMSTSYLRQMVKREARKAEISEAAKVSPHTLRHTAAVDLLRDTERLEVVQDFLGHENVATTRRYARLVNGEVEEACRSFRSGSSSGDEVEAAQEGQEESLAALLDDASPEQVAFAQRVLEAAGGN